VTLRAGDAGGVDFTAAEGEPVLELLYASPNVTPADGETPVTLLAKVTHALGREALSGVTIDLRPIGGADAQVMHDDGAGGDETAGDGVFSLQTTIAPNTPPGLQLLPVRAIDAAGNQTLGLLAAGVSHTGSTRLAACDTWEGSVEVPRFARELVITIEAAQDGGALLLDLFRPYGLEWRWWKTLQLTEAQTQYRIKHPLPGTWRYRITHACEQSAGRLSALQAKDIPLSVRSSLSGLGSISGRITDARTGAGVAKARVRIGRFSARTDDNGYYSRTLPAGAYSVRVHAFGHTRLKKSAVITENANTALNAAIDRRFRFDDDDTPASGMPGD
jgi:hypothetical protein